MDDISIVLPDNVVEIVLNKTLELPFGLQQDFFTDFRTCFSDTLARIFADYGIELKPYEVIHRSCDLATADGFSDDDIDWDYYIRYGYGEYGFMVLNDIGYSKSQSLVRSFQKLINLKTLGNFNYIVYSPFEHISITQPKSVQISGYFYNFSKNLKKPWLVLLNVELDNHQFLSVLNRLRKNNIHNQLENQLNPYTHEGYCDAPLFFHRITGDIFRCSCFPKIEIRPKISHYVVDNICSLCTGKVPREHQQFCGYSQFSSWYWNYIKLLNNQDDDIHFGEKRVRDIFGYPPIGATKIVETFLYKVVCDVFDGYTVIRNYRCKKLEYLELDIWIPAVKLGIEYQGEQHYKPIKHWGGKAALEKRIANDKKKRRLCKKLNYHLIEFKSQESINYSLILNRIMKFHPYFFRFEGENN